MHDGPDDPHGDDPERWRIGDTPTAPAILAVCVLLLAALLLGELLHRFHVKVLTHSGAIMLLGMLANGCVLLANNGHHALIRQLLTVHDLIYYALLPPIIYEAGFSMRKRGFFANFVPILLLSVLGTLISILSTGFMLYGLAEAGGAPLQARRALGRRGDALRQPHLLDRPGGDALDPPRRQRAAAAVRPHLRRERTQRRAFDRLLQRVPRPVQARDDRPPRAPARRPSVWRAGAAAAAALLAGAARPRRGRRAAHTRGDQGVRLLGAPRRGDGPRLRRADAAAADVGGTAACGRAASPALLRADRVHGV